MSRIVVDLDKIEDREIPKAEAGDKGARALPDKAVKKRGVWRIILKVFLGLLALIVIVGGIGGFFYWQELKRSPAYSLAMVVDAARRDDKLALAVLVDTDRIVDAFVPQITDKAVELYGRGLPQGTLQKLARVASPILPALKNRAREELPRLIREKTRTVENVPFFMVAIGASQSLDIKIDGDIATVTSKLPDHPLELKMQRKGDLWQIIEIRDEPLARKIAEQVGQQIIAAANGTVDRTGEALGIPNLNQMLQKAEELLQ
jgi:hypothetical protein